MSEPRLCRVAGRETWHVYDNRRRISTGETSRPAALRFLADYKAGLAAPVRPAARTVERVLAEYLVTRAKVPGRAERLAWAHKPLVRHLGPQLAEDVDPAGYPAKRAAEGVQPGTVRKELQSLRAALRWAQISVAVDLPARPPSRTRWLAREESERLVAACKAPHVKLFVLLALNTAARSGAIRELTWDRVDLDARTVDFRDPGKVESRKRRVMAPINDTLLAALLAAKDRAASPYVVEWAGGKVASVKHAFRDAAARAGLGADVTPHTLRHTAVTYMMQRKVPVWQVAGLAGMTIEMIETVYGHQHPDYLAEAVAALQQ